MKKPFYGNSKKEYVEKDGVLGKECSHCKQWKPIDSYGVAKRRWDGRRETCKECRKLANGKRNDYYRKYNAEHKEERRKTQIQCRIKYDHNSRLRIKRNTDAAFKLRTNISNLIRSSLKRKGHYKNRSWSFVVGYDVYELKEHLESLFVDGMNWDNYGKWHVDHIRPVASFKYSSCDDEEFKKCWDIKNLQPLWAEDNLRKSDRMGG
jgi:hypothetical protein